MSFRRTRSARTPGAMLPEPGPMLPVVFILSALVVLVGYDSGET